MIRKISLKNYRSIHSDDISLEPITVLIDANGSGKSNLVKTLQFLSEIPAVGITQAINKEGRRESVVPKSVQKGQLKSRL